MKLLIVIFVATSQMALTCESADFGRDEIRDEWDITATAIGETANRIQIYLDDTTKLPDSLTDLTQREGFLNRVTDAWDRPLLYGVSADDTLSLGSLGCDGLLGGTGTNTDISATYKLIALKDGRRVLWQLHWP